MMRFFVCSDWASSPYYNFSESKKIFVQLLKHEFEQNIINILLNKKKFNKVWLKRLNFFRLFFEYEMFFWEKKFIRFLKERKSDILLLNNFLYYFIFIHRNIYRNYSGKFEKLVVHSPARKLPTKISRYLSCNFFL